MGVFIKAYLFSIFEIEIVDKLVDGIIGIRFTHKPSDYSFVLFSCYLPPEMSHWGRDASSFFAHLLSQIYLFSHLDAIYVCGDVNSRIGGLSDYLNEVDNIPLRHSIDDCVNRHGEAFLEFLLDSKMCVLNGRINPLDDNFTSISMKGRAVVDYIAVPFDCLGTCLEFKVLPSTQLISNCQCFDLISDRCRVPDHSLLFLKFAIRAQDEIVGEEINHELNKANMIFKRRLSRRAPNQMCSYTMEKGLKEQIDKMQTMEKTQNELDNWYSGVCDLLYRELGNGQMNKGRSNFKNKRPNKPFWNEELNDLWKTMRNAEHIYLKYKGDKTQKEHYRVNYKLSQNRFDKRLRYLKRQYNKGYILHLEETHAVNPQRFWDQINKLGPKRQKKIPMEVYDDKGQLISDIPQVLNEWERCFRDLFSGKQEGENFDAAFAENICLLKSQLEKRSPHSTLNQGNVLNEIINIEEVKTAISALKVGKASGFDELTNEMLKSTWFTEALYVLFDFCFETGTIPSVWYKAIVSPIPKSTKNDPRIPVNYRGISLLSTVYKVYSSILNSRLTNYLEQNNLLVEEQNGFRKARACIDHIFSITTVVNNRIMQNKSSFACYIDFQKAFDFVNRDLLFYRLLEEGIHGRFYWAIQSLYKDPHACVRVNEYCSGWFPTPSGVKQGDCLSPTLFAIFINNLAIEIKQLGLGLNYDGSNKLDILMYADDIILVAENENDLQIMLTCTEQWCKKWKLTVNHSKTQIMHFRQIRTKRSDFQFQFGKQKLQYVENYKYLGLNLDEHLLYDYGTSVLAGSAGRALGGIIAKTKQLGDLGYAAYSKLFHTCVCPVMDYMAGIWGSNTNMKGQMVQNRAIRYFLGVHKFAPVLAITGDMGWEPCEIRWRGSMVALWNRLIRMPENRVARKIFNWDVSVKGAWASAVEDILISIGLHDSFINNSIVNTSIVKDTLYSLHQNKWSQDILYKPKLRTFVMIKSCYGSEKYVCAPLSKRPRSLCAKLCSGILPLLLDW